MLGNDPVSSTARNGKGQTACLRSGRKILLKLCACICMKKQKMLGKYLLRWRIGLSIYLLLILFSSFIVAFYLIVVPVWFGRICFNYVHVNV